MDRVNSQEMAVSIAIRHESGPHPDLHSQGIVMAPTRSMHMCT